MLDSIASERKVVILMGDMNVNLLKTSRTSQFDNLLLNTEDHGLTQLISKPTQITNHSKLLIDVLSLFQQSRQPAPWL